jgi:integrase
VSDLVDQHLARLTEDGRSPVTMSTYRFTTTKLKKFIGGLRVGEASPARIDAALRSMRNAHGATMARQSKTILRGALQLAVMSSVLGTNPVRDVQPLRSKNQPNGAVALTADQLRELLVNIRASSFCEKHDLVDPITLLVATGLRRSAPGIALGGLRREGRHAHGYRENHPRDRAGADAGRPNEVGSGTADPPAAEVRDRDAAAPQPSPLFRRADGHLPVYCRHAA